MKEKLYELKHTRKGVLDAAEAALKAKDMVTYDAKMAEVKTLGAEIDGYEGLMAEQGRFEGGDEKLLNLHDAQKKEKENKAEIAALDEIRGSDEYAKAWGKAIREQITVKRGRGHEDLAPLYKALTVTGGDPVGADGGFLVPVDFDNILREILRDYVDLSTLFTVESVKTMSGWRAIETSDIRKRLPEMTEMQSIPKDDQPKFRRIDYKVRKFGDRLPVSSELMSDNSVGLMRYLANWFAPKYVMTKNSLLLQLLGSLTPLAVTPGSELKDIKTTLNVGLRTAISRSAVLLTNQSGFNEMDMWEDGNGRPLLQPDPTNGTVHRLTGRKVIYADNDQIEVTGGNAPLYLGDFRQFGILFERKGIEVAATDIGGDAWATDSTELRALCRMDAQLVDTTAATALTFPVSV